jgi:hypothetical protein
MVLDVHPYIREDAFNKATRTAAKNLTKFGGRGSLVIPETLYHISLSGKWDTPNHGLPPQNVTKL